MEYKQVQYKPGKVTQIIFNRPEYLNAQSYQMLAEADQAFTAAASDQNCGAIVLSGAGRAFSAGHDLDGGRNPILPGTRPDGAH